ncbi:hypothetical protein O181_040009 [Austropuccinia psidii MF-1]|uniref:Uncharacterized protein n=1 Tax=Austropuccinia psidii MF-1 TaxID=1389203 RepID=A0A9Q3DBK5_9BASI|nr:hypothetical protein [Austropuccinia psidii MF-1]
MLICCPTLPTTWPEEFATKTLLEDSFVVNDYESIPKREWMPGPKTGRHELLWTISPVPSSIDLCTPPPRPPSDGHFTPQLEQSDYPADEGWRCGEDIQAWANCHHVLSPMGFKRQKQNQPNPLQQDSPVPSLPCGQPPQKPTAGLSGMQWSEDLYHGKQPKFHLISTLDSIDLTLPPFGEPFQPKEPPIPGPSPSSEPHEDVLTREPEPEVAPTQCMEEPFGKPQIYFFYSSQLFLTFPLTISSLPHTTPLCDHHQQYTCRIHLPLMFPLHPLLPWWRSLTLPPRTQLPPPLTPTLRLARNSLICDRH